MMFKKGEIYLANLNPRKGNEVGKLRPVLIYQTDMLNDIEHPTTIVLPLSTQLVKDSYPLRYRLNKREKLQQTSEVICDHIRAVDNKRIKKGIVATLSIKEMMQIDIQVKMVLGIDV